MVSKPLTSSSTYDNTDILQWEDDDVALSSAASKSRMPFNSVTAAELSAFPDIEERKSNVDIYLYARNKILQLWHLNPRQEVTFDAVMNELSAPYDSDPTLVRRILEYLQRYGYINFGLFFRVIAALKIRRRVIVIGAGIAGLIAAKQLQRFGLDVVVLEGRSRTGGRISTYIKSNFGGMGMVSNKRLSSVADLGASVIRGTIGNPLFTLTQQCDVYCSPADMTFCTLYNSNGRQIDERRASHVERAFNKMLRLASYLAHRKQLDDDMSLGDTLMVILKQLEHRQQSKRIRFFSSYSEILTNMKVIQDTMVLERKTLSELNKTFLEIKAKENLVNVGEEEQMENEILLKCIINDINDTFERYKSCEARRSELDRALIELRKNEPSEVYMNESDKRILRFHIANLEYSLGTFIDNVSMKNWDHNLNYELEGVNLSIVEGFGSLTDFLCDGLKIRLGHAVSEIKYDSDGVNVVSLVGSHSQSVHADVCLCTIPLGVLKHSIRSWRKCDAQAPRFTPDLPQCKVNAIESLGFGNLNKLILFFEKPFWGEQPLFGRVHETSGESRGELFIFQAPNEKQPILVGLIVGDSADASENMEERELVNAAMKFLRSVFGVACPDEPLEAVLTRWKSDVFSRGAFSYVSVGGSAEAYDVMAAPVKDSAGNDRLFFAGEHTSRRYTGTAHGAFISGLEQAGRIADQLTGCPYANVVSSYSYEKS